jgi:hypothetical protein
MPLAFGKSSPSDVISKARRDLRRLEIAEAGADQVGMSDALMDLSIAIDSVEDWLKRHAARSTAASFQTTDVAALFRSSALMSFADIANEFKHAGPRREATTAEVLTSVPSSSLPFDKARSLAPPLKVSRKDASRHRVTDLARTAIAELEAFANRHGIT